jgi:hypothetical protein
MGQVNVVLAGLQHINKNGSFTLTSGILNRDPIPLGSSAAHISEAMNLYLLLVRHLLIVRALRDYRHGKCILLADVYLKSMQKI